MKGVEMYHAIKSLQATGKSDREIASLLSISKTTVQKYKKIDSSESYKTFFEPTRKSKLEPYRTDFEEKLLHNPKLRASKMHRNFLKKHLEVKIGERAFRNFISKIKKELTVSHTRYYRVVDYQPGAQMQVDPGEMKVKNLFGEEFKVYFVAFIFPYCKRKFVYFQERAFNTTDFITAHEECFRYFGYLPKEMIYDQTKLVVIKEKYREVWFNEKFYQYITKKEVSPYVCEGYDPQSKGIVENAVKEVKHDFLAGEEFFDIDDIRNKSLDWLKEVDEREHCTLRATPTSYFEKEKPFLKPYIFTSYEERKVDKTGLFSYKSNKYSAPYLYQRKKVLINVSGETLQIFNQETMEQIATHKIATKKVRPIINNNHFRDYEKLLSELEDELKQLLVNYENSDKFVERLIKENSRNPRDQIRAVRNFFNKNSNLDWNVLIEKSLNFAEVRASKIENLVIQYKKKEQLEQIKSQSNKASSNVATSFLQRDLSIYDNVGGVL